MFELDWSFIGRVLPRFGEGVEVTLEVFTAALGISTTGAIGMALVGRSGSRLAAVVLGGFSWLFRGLPELIVLLFAYLALPHLGLQLRPFWAAVTGLAAIGMAYEYEIFRSALAAVPKAQFEAARALGISPAAMYRRIIAPQVLRIAITPYITFACGSLKRTSVASAVAVTEIMGLSRRLTEAFQRPFELMLIAMMLYVMLSSILMLVEQVVDRRLSHGHASDP